MKRAHDLRDPLDSQSVLQNQYCLPLQDVLEISNLTKACSSASSNLSDIEMVQNSSHGLMKEIANIMGSQNIILLLVLPVHQRRKLEDPSPCKPALLNLQQTRPF